MSGRAFSGMVACRSIVAAGLLFLGGLFAAGSSLEQSRSEGERHAQSQAIVNFGYAAPTKGRLILVRDKGAVCAVRFNAFTRGHDAKPGNAFNSGDESFSAEYEWYGVDGKTGASTSSGKANVKRSATLGIGRLVLPSTSAALKCGSIQGLSWNYPMYVSMFSGQKPQASRTEVAPTGWTDIKQLNLHDPRLRWYGYDEKRPVLLLPLADLPN